jgi:NitT/TauT family transport system permease protein
MDDVTKRRRQIESFVLPILAAAILIFAWHLAVTLTATKVMPAPLAVWKGGVELARKGILLAYIRDSLLRVGLGFTLAALVGIPLGMAVGLYRPLEQALDPVIQILRPISPLAWIPVAIVIFGIHPAAAVSLIFLASLFPILVSSANAVRSVPPMYIQAGENFGLSRPALFARVILPAALPELITGLRIAFGVAWIVVVAAEMVAVDSGLGYLIVDSRNAGKRYDLVVAAMLLIGVIGLLLDGFFRALERMRWLRWGFRAES